MSVQKTFQSILGKFSDGIVVLSGFTNYNPSKPELKIVALTELKKNAELKNSAVINTGITLKQLRSHRNVISFKSPEADVNCLESLLKNIGYYIKAELGASDPIYKKINSILHKLRPVYVSKEGAPEGEKPKRIHSSSEKSFQGLAGYANDIVSLLTSLGVNYNPSNQNISIANLKSKIEELNSINSQLVNAENEYSIAVSEREEIYKGEYGINNRIILIKTYLASLEGGKNSAEYKAFALALK